MRQCHGQPSCCCSVCLATAAVLAPKETQARRTPHAGYHGQGQIEFFEGWYNRITLPENDQSFAFIYAIFDPGRRTARSGVDAQVLASTADATKAICASSTDCSPPAAAPHDLSLRYAGADFSFAMTSVQHQGPLGAASRGTSASARTSAGAGASAPRGSTRRRAGSRRSGRS